MRNSRHKEYLGTENRQPVMHSSGMSNQHHSRECAVS